MSTHPSDHSTSQSKDALRQRLHELGNLSSNATVQFHQAAAEKFKLNATDMKTLPLLQSRGSISAGDIAASLGLTTGAITNVIDRLEKSGLVRRTADPNDRRRVLVEVVPEGMKKAAAVYGPMGQAVQELSQKYTAEQLAVITDFVERTTEIMQREARNLRAQK